jgi:hypothetical protein
MFPGIHRGGGSLFEDFAQHQRGGRQIDYAKVAVWIGEAARPSTASPARRHRSDRKNVGYGTGVVQRIRGETRTGLGPIKRSEARTPAVAAGTAQSWLERVSFVWNQT